ncbi:MAG: 50S ribosomal protein L9 [Candidatus Marinimicrobia bacterium]|nr:50S ribosomal protein L9 [Candidatus Neomarinimicrobiota bacterium]
MEIILTQDVDSLGPVGQVLQVAPGYARNYLFPKGLALRATPANLRKLEEAARLAANRELRERAELGKLADKLAKTELTAQVTVGDDDKVFGSVTSQNIADLLAEKGYDLSRRDINLEEPIKALGQYDVEVKLGHGVTGSVKVWVVRE